MLDRRIPRVISAEQQQPLLLRPCGLRRLFHSGGKHLVYKKKGAAFRVPLLPLRPDFDFFHCSKRSVIAIRVCFSSQGDIKREARHLAESLEGAFWWKLASSLGVTVAPQVPLPRLCFLPETLFCDLVRGFGKSRSPAFPAATRH